MSLIAERGANGARLSDGILPTLAIHANVIGTNSNGWTGMEARLTLGWNTCHRVCAICLSWPTIYDRKMKLYGEILHQICLWNQPNGRMLNYVWAVIHDKYQELTSIHWISWCPKRPSWTGLDTNYVCLWNQPNGGMLGKVWGFLHNQYPKLIHLNAMVSRQVLNSCLQRIG